MKAEVFVEWLNRECKTLMSLDKPLTDLQADTLLKKYDTNYLQNLCLKLENYKPLKQKYRSTYLTILKWIEIDERAGIAIYSEQNIVKKVEKDYEYYKHQFLAAHPPGSIVKIDKKNFKVDYDRLICQDDETIMVMSFFINKYYLKKQNKE